MSILLIANYKTSMGGISVQVELLQNKIQKEGLQITIFNTKRNNFYRLFILPLELFVKGFNKKIFHIHGSSYAGFFPVVLGVIIGKLLRKKIIITYHGGDAYSFFSRYNRLVKLFFKQADKVIVLSGFLKKIFDTISIETEVIPNIIDIQNHFKARKNFKPALITTRSLSEVYNIETAINALSVLQKKFPDASLRIIGKGPEEEKLKQKVSKEKISNVFFEGFVNNEYIYEKLELADFWCNPTTKDNMPMSLLEAANAGLVIVSTNAGGIPYMVEHKKSAWLVNIYDFEDIANGIIYLIENKNIAEAMTINARSTLENYSWSTIKEKLLAIYKN